MQQVKRSYTACKFSHCNLRTIPNSDDAFTSLEELRPSVQKLLWVLRKCTKERNLAYALHMLAYLQRNGLEAHSLLENYTVSMFVEAGSMSDARNVFDRLVSRNEHSWNCLINGYIEHEQSERALVIYQKMQVDAIYPSGYTFVALLKACTKLKNMIKGREIHKDISRSGLLNKDLFVGSALVDMYAKCGFLENAHEVFDKLPIRNVVSWNSLISGYAKHDCGEEALNLFERMQVAGVSPNAVTFICSLKACASINAINKGREIHAEIIRRCLLERHSTIGNALVDMYAKCGSLSKAQEVFSKLSHRDVASWNALIAGFVKHERGEEALTCVKQMQLDGFSPDVVTFACGLKACGITEDIEKGKELHAEVETKGLLKRHLVLGNTLVDMYGKCGLLALAQEVFDRLPIRDLISWNALASGYAKHEYDEEVLNCYEQMQLEGITPDSITFACSLKACANMGFIEKGRKLHEDLKRKGLLEDNVVVGNALVSMYAYCGDLAKGWEVFEKLPSRSVVSWNAVIAGYARQDCGEEALNCLRQMQKEGVSPSVVTFACSLKACGSIGETGQGIELHAEIARRGLLGRDMVLDISLIDMYTKCGLFANAQEVFDILAERDLVLWNALIAGYANHECGEEALCCFKRMRSEGVVPDAVTYSCIFKACGNTGNVEQGLETHAETERRGFVDKDLVVGNVLVDMYAKCGLLAKAHEVLKRLPVRNVVSWSALIAGYTKHEESETAINCYEQMQLEGVVPDAITLACILKACGCIVATCNGQKIHAEIERRGLSASDIVIGNALVDMYAKCGYLTIAHELFDKLPMRDVVSWNALVAGCLRHELGEVALDYFDQMLLEGVSPDAVTYACSLKACGSIGATHKGKEMHAKIEKHELLERDVSVGNALVDMYAKGGLLAEAQEVFDKLPNKNTISWNALIAGYAQIGLSDNVFGTLQRMVDEGDKPDLATFVSVLNACSHTGLVDKAVAYFDAMSKDHGIIPTIEHLSCVVDLLGRAGQLESAVAVTQKLPVHPDLVVSSTVLGACRKWGDMVLGRQAFEDASRLYVKEASTYICMYNIYADADMQLSAEKIKYQKVILR